MNFEFRKLTPAEQEIIKHNVAMFDMQFDRAYKRCANKTCKYPISVLNEIRVIMLGQVCELCWDMYQSLCWIGLRNQSHFRQAHEEDQRGRNGTT